MREKLTTSLTILLMIVMLTGCQPTKPSSDLDDGNDRNAEVTISAASVERLVNNTYRKYFGRHHLYCCDDDITDDGIFHATFYGDEDRIELFVEYDTKNKVLKSNAAEQYHREAIEEAVGALIEEMTGLRGGEEETATYDIRIRSEMSETFIEDYDEFVASEGTTIDIVLVFDKKISDTEEEQLQTLVKKLKEQQFKGELSYYGDGEDKGDIEI